MTDDLVKRLLDLGDRFSKCRDRDTVLEAAAEVKALTAERDWLRAALKAIVVGVDEDFDEATQQNVTTWFSDQDMQDIARAALKGETL